MIIDLIELAFKAILWLGAALIVCDLLVKYHRFLTHQQGRLSSLTYASHGAGLFAMAIYLHLSKLEMPEWLMLGWRFVVPGMTVLGIYWLVVGAARSRGIRDSMLIGRSLAKVGGGGVKYFWIITLFDGLLLSALKAVCLWLVVTGATKLVLVSIGQPRDDFDRLIKDQQAHGTADHDDPSNLDK